MRKFVWIAAAATFFIAAVLFIVVTVRGGEETLPSEPDPSALSTLKVYVEDTEPVIETETETETEIQIQTETETLPSETEPAETETVVTETESVTEPTETQATRVDAGSYTGERTEDLLDFTALKAINPDIIAWLEIDGTVIDYPVLQNAYSDAKYLKTYYDGSYYVGGSLFTEHTYNSTDFNDPVTIIYGHYMHSGALFGSLQSSYSSASAFAEHSDIRLYLPGEVRHYTVFAAVPFDTYHILAAYDFTKGYWYRSFFKMVAQIREIGAQFNTDITPEPGDRVLILSTCLNGDSSARYLVMAICNDDLPQG